MLSPFTIKNKQLSFQRFPIAQVNRSLQAWDAADEFLINYLNEQELLTDNNKHLVIFNDSFGALSLSCCLQQTTSITDSYVSQQGLILNQQANQLNDYPINLLTSLDKLPEKADIILYKIPKSKALLIDQLIQIKIFSNNNRLNNTLFIAAARTKDIHSSTLKLFEKYLGDTSTSLAVKKARLVFCQFNSKQQVASSPVTTWLLENTTFNIANYANVFAREQLDIGARFFIEHLPTLAENSQVIDLGCGNGVIGLSLLAKQQAASKNSVQLTFIDESFMAVASAQLNIKNNLPQHQSQCQFSCNDCLTAIDDESADLILCNPPFHQQQAVTDHIAWQMFQDSYRVLKKGAELRIIGNRQLGYHVKLERLFKSTTLIASNKKFVIISAIK
ncbi:MAG: 23S rRNA (guanine(1835)-N(2))-methyltransferase [Gammaproteobacteria bacterium]|nr:MAG: 23S rRNA (guanine(1835)-N(2))-methyltransferase [Gammaproteobacteria bacterium]